MEDVVEGYKSEPIFGDQVNSVDLGQSIPLVKAVVALRFRNRLT